MTSDPGPRTSDGAQSAPWLIHLDEVPSTNTWALDHFQALAHGAVVWTTRQTGGRGRGGKVWMAPPGVLTASVVLHLPTPPGPLALAAGLAVLHAAEDLTPGLRIGLKWPNDLVVGRRKLAGLLVERPSAQVAVVGVGLNLAAHWEGDLAEQRTSLTDHGADLNTDVASQVSALTAIRRYLLEASGLLRAGGFANLLPTLRERDVLAGQVVAVQDGARIHGGIAGGFDDAGRLLVGATPVTSGTVTSWVSTVSDGPSAL